ncbi:hypothetical protein D3C81_1724830 [compost metagenome]
MGPVVVIDHPDLVIPIGQKQLFHLSGKLVHILLHLLQGLQRTLRLTAAGITDGAGGAANQNYRTVAGQLEPLEHHKRNQVADMHAVVSRVNTAIEGNGLLLGQSAQAFRVRLLVDGVPPLQFINNIHACKHSFEVIEKCKKPPLPVTGHRDGCNNRGTTHFA